MEAAAVRSAAMESTAAPVEALPAAESAANTMEAAPAPDRTSGVSEVVAPT